MPANKLPPLVEVSHHALVLGVHDNVRFWIDLTPLSCVQLLSAFEVLGSPLGLTPSSRYVDSGMSASDEPFTGSPSELLWFMR